MARNPRRSDPTGSYRKRVEESDAYENIAGMLPGIGTAMTITDIEDELKKEEPNYLKIGMLAGTEAIGLIPGLGTAAKSMIRKGADMAQQTDNIIDVTSSIPKVKTKKDFSNFNFNQLNLSSDEIEKLADVNKRFLSSGGKSKAIQEAEKKVQDTIDAKIPLIEKALADALTTNKGVVTLEDYKNAVEATINYEDLKSAATDIANQQGLLNKMGASIGFDMAFDDAVDAAVETFPSISRGEPNDLLIDLLNGGYQDDLVDWATTENAIRKSYDKYLTSKKLDKDYAGYAEGGVAMDEQMDAVFKSSRTDIDPVSGNEVPPGSLPEEVRDDIPAMLSEGEYVVPADVLRFYGVKFFEDLRAQAKMGLAEMEANGRIGGEPIEEETGDVGISDQELMVIMAQAPQEEQQVMANQGGLMGFQAGGLNYPAYIKQPDLTQFGMAGPDFQGGLEYRTYVNDAGMEITIPFFDGDPMGMIPPGYTLKGEVAQQEEAPQVSQDDDDPVRVQRPAPEEFDLDAIPTEELEKTARGLSTMNSIATGIASAAGLPVAALVNTAGVARYNDVLDRLKAEDPIAFEKSGLEKKGSIFGGESSLYENLKDRSDEQEGNKPGADFGDTWLGDFLGFDGEAGVQGPGLRDSIGGARRTGDGGTASSTKPSNNDDGPSPAPTPTVIPTGATLATGTVLNDPDDPVVSTIDDSGKEVLKNESSLSEGQKAAMDWDE